ncbi:MAG: SDR family oxidoreductase [Croceimicrobium sp.]
MKAELKSMHVLVAGATGYLGGYIIKELAERNFFYKAIARSPQKLKALKADQVIKAEVTQAESLRGICAGMDVVISTVGITRQKNGLTYMDVDYQANLNLLREAQKAGVKKFIYISAINGDKMRQLKIFEAKEAFVDELKKSGLDYTVLRPNGFFSDMRDFLEMAKRGRVYLFGSGQYRLNPIHGADLAEVVVDAIRSPEREISLGGPDILTQNEIAALALDTWYRDVKITHLPDWTRRLSIGLLRTFTSSKTYGPIEFFLTAMAMDNVAPRCGTHRLYEFFKSETEQKR